MPSQLDAAARERVLKLVSAARRVADASDELGREARALLPGVTGLSREGVELALERCLETHPSERELTALQRSVAAAPKAHVLLSANVFVAAHRAIALGLAASAHVTVRPSRRAPHMAELLARAAPGLFELTDAIEAAPGEHVFAYGSDETMAALQTELAPGVVLHRHGSGFAAAILDAAHATPAAAARLALDLSLFDQRGCLSPRIALVVGGAPHAFARALAGALTELERRVPCGELSGEEAAAVANYRDTMTIAGDVLPAGRGFISVMERAESLVIAPVGRNCHVAACADARELLEPHARWLTAVAIEGPEALTRELAEALPHCRVARVGELQSPPFDGPVDRRPT